MPQMYEVRSLPSQDLVMIAPLFAVRHFLLMSPMEGAVLIRESKVQIFTPAFGEVVVKELPFELSFPGGPTRPSLEEHEASLCSFLKRQAE